MLLADSQYHAASGFRETDGMQAELKQIADLALFAKIVETGGISRCAKELGMERTTVSRRIRSLEHVLGVSLLDRSNRQVRVTTAGRRCFEHCVEMIEASKTARRVAEDGAYRSSDKPLVVGAPLDMIEKLLRPRLTDFMQGGGLVELYPVLTWTPSIVATIDIGLLHASEKIAGCWQKKLGAVQQSAYASRDYLQAVGHLSSPSEFEAYDCITDNARLKAWKFQDDGEALRVAITAKYCVSNLLEAREATEAGLGIAMLPDYMCETKVEEGRLIRLCPDFTAESRDINALNPRTPSLKPRLTSLRYFLEEVLSSSYCASSTGD